MVRALASHAECGPGLSPGINAIMWVEFVVGSLLCSAFPNSNSTENQADEGLPNGSAASKSLFYCLLI